MGYPRGLTDKDFLIGAKILAVADIMEAISSHRPYRAAKGSDAAVEEIKKQRGTALDPKAVDSCLKLLFDEAYQLTER